MKKLGIKYQLRMTTLIPVILVALLFAIFFNSQLNSDLNQQMSHLGEAYIRQLLPAAQFSMMNNDSQSLQTLINASTLRPELKALAFYNTQGHLLSYRGGKHPINQPLKLPEYTGDFIESKQLQPHTLNFLAPVTRPKFNYSTEASKTSKELKPLQADDILGWLSIEVDTQSLMIKRYRMYLITIFITLGGLLLSLLVNYCLSSRIYRPIARLRRSMKQILANEFETQIAVGSTGELGLIEQGCWHLQKRYLTTIHEMHQHVDLATKDLQQSLESLEEKNIELSLEKKKTEEKSRQKSEFIANMSHEIRTPMNGVLGFTNVLLESRLDPLQLDYVNTIKSSAQDLLAIINDILDYSKIDAGKLRLDCIPMDLRNCIDEVLALSSPIANKKGVDLIAITEPKVPKTVLGDPLRIKQIISNLVNNALKFTDQGYVLMRTSIEQEREADYTLCLSVSDSGLGISKEDQGKLFQAFNQADTTITRRYGGSGLGLVICKKLVEEMGGRITLNSELNKGSTFSATIKLEKLTAYEVEKHQSQRFDHLKVLCFDDNALYLEAICKSLTFLGVECLRVRAFNQLEAAFKEQSGCKLAFINVNDGFEKQVAQILRKQSLPCVLVSKYPIPDPQAYGGCAFLFKPINIQKLHETIELMINQVSHNKTANYELDYVRAQLRLAHPELLIAEDNPVNRMLLISLLSEHAKIKAVENGEEALRACKEKRFNVILLDLQMPKLNGLDAARLIRKESMLNKQTAIIIISANSNDLNKEAMQKAGIDLFLQKPIDEKELLSQLLILIKKSKPAAIDWQVCVQKVSGNQGLAEEFLTHFVADLHKNRAEFLQLLEDNDLKGLEASAHKLHGACCFCGVPKLQMQVVRLEKEAKEAKKIEEINLSFKELIQSIDEVIDEFNNFYKAS